MMSTRPGTKRTDTFNPLAAGKMQLVMVALALMQSM